MAVNLHDSSGGLGNNEPTTKALRDIRRRKRSSQTASDPSRLEWALEEGLEGSFPASDPVSIVQPRAFRRRSPRRRPGTWKS